MARIGKMNCKKIVAYNYIDTYLCSPELANSFIIWFIWNTVDSFGSMSPEGIAGSVAENYHVSVKAVKDYVKENLQKGVGGYRLSENQKRILNSVQDFRTLFQSEEIKQNDWIGKTINDALAIGKLDSVQTCVAVGKLDQISNSRSDIDYQILFFEHLVEQSSDTDVINQAIVHVLPENLSIPLNVYFSNQTLLKVFAMGGIKDIDQLLSEDARTLTDVFFLDEDNLCQTLTGMSETLKVSLEIMCDLFYASLEKRDGSPKRAAFDLRHGVGEGLTSHTLEEVGQKLGLTRERVRQLELIGDKALVEHSSTIINYGTSWLFQTFGDFKIVQYDEAKKKYGEGNGIDVLAITSSISQDQRLAYDEGLSLFYSPKNTSLYEIKFKTLDGLNEILTVSEFSKHKAFEQKIISSEYSLRECGFYLRKNKPTSYLITSVIDRFFPSGYHFNGRDYNDLVGCLKKTYGANFEVPSPHAIEALIQRKGDYCQIDKGTYKSRSMIEEPPLLLILQISDYINSNGPAVFYKSIFDHFKDELLKLGVDNNFYLKGLIDSDLVSYGFHTKRDYVQVKGTSMTSKEVMSAFINNQPSVFTMQELRNKFPGVKDYTIQYQLLQEESVLWLGNERFVLLQNCGITDAGKSMIENELTEALGANNGATSAHKVYSRIQVFHPGFEKELGHIKSSFALYSYIQSLPENKSKYDMRRPFVSLAGNGKATTESLMVDHFSPLQEFTKADCDAYREKLGITGQNFSFISFADSMCDDFVLIDRYQVVAKDRFLEAENEIAKIQSAMLSIVRTRGEFSSVDTASLSFFPRSVAGFEMNKYLLLGILNTFEQLSFSTEITATGTDIDYKVMEAK